MEKGDEPSQVLDYRAPCDPSPAWPGWRQLAAFASGTTWGAAIGLFVALAFCRFLTTFALFRLPIWVYFGAIAGLIIQQRRATGTVVAQFWRAALGGIVLIALCLYVLGGNTRLRAELEHGMSLPWSAHNIQCRGDALTSFTNRAAITWFEIDHADLDPFLARLSINSRGGSWASWGKPRRRVWAPWSTPQNCGHVKTWSGQETPNQALHCQSPVGDYLIVEVLDKPDGGHVVKMFTDWN